MRSICVMIAVLLMMVMITLVIPTSPVTLAQQGKEALERPALKQFDEDTARSRRELRAYCIIVQELVAAQHPDTAKRDEALKHLKAAQSQWAEICAKYQNSAPQEYARDPYWKGRLVDIGIAIDDMVAHMEAERFKRSFQACGSGCGLFVAMHEENNLTYALDRLFHLRKAIKTAQTLNKTSGLHGLREFVPDLLNLRNRALLAQCPCSDAPDRCRKYGETLLALSGQMDWLARQVVRGEAEEATKSLSKLMELVQQVYDLAL